MDSSTSNESLLQDQSSSRSYRHKLKFFILLIIIFTLIITSIIAVFAMLKHQVDSESLPLNPINAIRQVCYYNFNIFEFEDGFQQPFDLCIESISLLHVNSSFKTNPSKIFSLSLLAAINQLIEIISSTKALLPKFKNLKYEASMKNCSVLFDHSLTHLRNSMSVIGVDPDENSLRNKKMVGDMTTWINIAENDIVACLDCLNGERKYGSWIGVEEFRVKANIARAYVSNSFVILENIEDIFDMFYPKIGSVAGFFLRTSDSFISLGLFCIQFVLLAALFGVLLRLNRR